MIPRELLKKIRQIERRTNRLVTAVAARGCARIPTGFCLKAQGCEERATLGRCHAGITNRNAAATLSFSSGALRICRNPVGVDENLILVTQGSVATLDYMPESPWDSPMVANPARANSSFCIQPSSFPLAWGEGRDEGGQNRLNLTTDQLPNLNYWNSLAFDGLAGAGAGFADAAATLADDGADLANDAASFADDAAGLADDRAAFADDAAHFADDRATYADSAALLADDTASFADGRDVGAHDRAKTANIPAISADSQVHFADNAATAAERGCWDAGARVSSAKRVFIHLCRQIYFSQP